MSSVLLAGINLIRRIKIIESYKDAIEFLEADHAKILVAFQAYRRLPPTDYPSRRLLINTICSDLTKHAIIERELLCPAFQLDAGCACEINKALEDHLNADALIWLLQSISLQDRKFGATVTKLFDQFEKHIVEEERDIFSWAKLSDVNLILLGRQMAERMIELNQAEV